MIKDKKFSRDNLQVAIVDDDKDDRLLLNKALAKVNGTTKVDMFSSGEKFLEYLHTPMAELPDISLIDINMPEKDGFQVIREIKNDLNLAPLCVLVYSTSNSHFDIRKAMDAGANGYIQKPNSYRELLGICEVILQKDWRESCPANNLEDFMITY